MQKAAFTLLLFFICVETATAQHTPITVSGFNHDVIADGTGNSAVSTTTKEMDAITPSNYVLCSKQFATANSFTPANTYGLPDNGTITSGGRTYQLSNYNGNQDLYLMTTESGTLTLTTPSNFSSISIAALGTEGAATLSIVFNFTDGSSQNSNASFEDWFNGTTGVILQGFGRVKRVAAPFTGNYAGAPDNPRIYSREFALPCSKTLQSISFTNTSSASATQSNRAHIFAISGVESIPPPQPVITGGGITVCPGATPTLSVQSPVSGTTYSWYTVPSLGVAFTTGTSYTTAPLSGTITYYVEASGTCAGSVRTPVTVTVTPPPAAPIASGTTVCSATTATLSVQSPVAGYTYSWHATCAGASLATGTSFTTPSLTALATYYVKAINSCSTAGNCTPVTVNVLPLVSAPTATGTTICPGATATLSVQSPIVGVTYSWFAAATGGSALATGTSFTTPSLSSTTTYYVQAQDGCGPSSRTAVTVSVTPTVTAPVVNNANACPGNNVTLSVQTPAPGVTYKWYNAATGGSLVFTGTSLTVPAPIASITYYVEASNSCSVSIRVAVTINVTTVTTPIVPGATICAGSTALLNIQNVVGSETYSWYTVATGGTSIATGTTFTTPALSANTTYYVEAVNSTACTGPARVAVTVTVIPILTAPVVSVSNVTVSSITFSWIAITNATAYEVSLNNGTSWITPSSGATGLTHTVTGLAQFQNVCIQVRAIRTPSCANSTSTTLCGKTLSTNIFIPNTFTPNGDGKNDIFFVHSNGIQSMKIQVFDQWGERIFESQDITKGWDGTYQGKVQPVGVYAYVFKATLNDGSSVTKHGSISLIR